MRTAVFAILAVVPMAAQAQWLKPRATVTGIEILNYGVYETVGDPTSEIAHAGVANGKLSNIVDYKLLERTDVICARLNLSFGFEFTVKGSPSGAEVTLNWVTQFPPVGVTNDKGVKFASNKLSGRHIVDDKDIRTFTFEEPYELVTGPWVLEFHYQGKLIGAQHFTVKDCAPVS
jgi:Domain of unknown function (DUF3859)